MAAQLMNSIKPFDGHGYSNWEFRIKLILEQNEVLNVIEMEPPEDPTEFATFKKNDVKARNLIIQTLTDDVLEMVKGKTTAKSIMMELKGTYEKSGIANQVQLQRKLRTLKYNGSESLNVFLVEFEKTIAELKNCGGRVGNSEIVTQLLSAMPDSYQPVTTAIDIMFYHDTTKLTLDFVKNKLLMEEIRQKQKEEGGATVCTQAFATGKGKSWNKTKYKEGEKHYFPFKCHYCGKKGHKKSECRKRKTEESGKCNVADREEEIVFMTASDAEEHAKIGITFVVDSGATNHLVNKTVGQFLVNVEDVDHKIGVAKVGEKVTAKRKGNLHLVTEEGKSVLLKNVLECEDLSRNLLSVRKLQENNLKVIFENNKVLIMKDKHIITKGNMYGNLYILNFNTLCANAIANEKYLWHRRMGHSVEYPITELCETCIQSKQTQLPRKPLEQERKAKRTLEVISSDVCGPISPCTFDGKKYFVSFIDHYTHFAMCYLIANKSEVFEKFKLYVATVEAKFNEKIEKLRCDNGGEYCSTEFQNFAKKKGINIQYTVPYNPQQNGIAERYNRTVMERARCLLFDSQLDKKFWGEAIKTAVYLINRSKTSVLSGNVTPAEMWYGFAPNLSKIRIFGCTAYVHVGKEERNSKLDPRSKKMYLMGYAENGYRLWNPEKEQIITARNIIFDERKKDKLVHIQNIIESKEEKVKEENETKEKDDDTAEKDDENIEMENEVRQRRGKRTIKLPSRYDDYEVELMAALSSETFLSEVPENYEDAMKIGNGWDIAIKEELSSLAKNKTWDIVSRPENTEIIDSRWVFREKQSDDKTIKKARLVARGYQQKDLSEEVYSPVARMLTIRLLLSLSVENGMHIHQLDVKCAFLNGILKKPVYMHIPEGIQGVAAGKVCKLRKSLYGLRQSPKCWYDKLNEYLLNVGFKRSKTDPCLYYKRMLFLLIHVDDLIITSKSLEEICTVKLDLVKKFEMKDLTNENKIKFLGLNILKTDNGLFIHQRDTVEKILDLFNMSECKPSKIPIVPKLNLKFVKENDKQNLKLPYRELIGCLMYVMLGSRPDLSFAVTYFSQFQNCFSNEHWLNLKQVLRYLKLTIDYGINYSKSENSNKCDVISAYVDSDFANDCNDRKSITGFVIKILNNVVFWKTRKQTTVSLSSAEAEYVALSSCTVECVFIAHLLEDIFEGKIYPIQIFEDNQSCIMIASTLETKRSKHIDVKHHFVRDCVAEGIVNLNYISTNEQIADMFTKPLSDVKLTYFRNKLNVFSMIH